MKRIYLDFNATTPVRPEVISEVTECLAGPPGNPSSLHSFGREAAELRQRARARVANAIDCREDQVVFTSGGTEANNLALRGVMARGQGRHIITAATEHEAVLETVHSLEQGGYDVTVLSVDSQGVVASHDVAQAMRPDTSLVTLMAANNETGVLHDVEGIGETCRAHGVLFHSDAVQLFGKAPVSFRQLPVDLMSISSHKIGGPKGTGALVVGERAHVCPQVTGGSQEQGLRPGTENLPGIVGFGKAAELASEELAEETRRLGKLRDDLERGLLERMPGLRIHGGSTTRLANTSNLGFAVSGESLLIALDLEGVAVSTGAACNAGAAEPSHVLLAMGHSKSQAEGSIRFSLGSTTTESEIEDVIRILPEVVSRIEGAPVPESQG